MPERFDAAAADRLAALDEDDHFWVRQRRLLFCRLLDRSCGSATPWWNSDAGPVACCRPGKAGSRRWLAVDAYRPLLARARARSGAATLIQSDVCATPLADGQFDMAAAFDVIEHVDPDALLSEAHDSSGLAGSCWYLRLRSSALWSAMDERAGHRCRYDSALLGLELRRNGWRYDGHTYFQCLLFPLVYLSRRLAGGTHPVERRPGRLLDRTLGLINRIEVTTSSRFSLPFGSSIVAWATRA